MKGLVGFIFFKIYKDWKRKLFVWFLFFYNKNLINVFFRKLEIIELKWRKWVNIVIGIIFILKKKLDKKYKIMVVKTLDIRI